MLSRTAAQLFWMSRYLERAENLVRMLDVTHSLSLLPQSRGAMTEFAAPLAVTGTLSPYIAQNRKLDGEALFHYMALDLDNPASVLSCLKLARENAHAVRGKITAEMWEAINASWLEAREMPKRGITDMSGFFDWIKERSHLFRGATYGTLQRNDAYCFIRLGTFIERADNTARLLDVKYHSLLPRADGLTSSTDFYQWGALLRSVSAFETYRHVYRDVITPYKVAELLILNHAMPRSLHACLDEINDILGDIANVHSAEATRQVGELHATLHYGRMDDIFEAGLHPWLERFLVRINRLGDSIGDNFLVPVAA